MKRWRYRAKYPGRAPAVTFTAKGTDQGAADTNALRYARGLLRARNGGKMPTSCARLAPVLPTAANPPDIDRAVKALENFSGGALRELEVYNVELPRAAWRLGILAQVNYIAERDGTVYEFEHRFADESRPLLVASDDGSMLIIVGGRYSVTDRGITDQE